MSEHDDFLDDYIGYRIFEDSMKGSGGGKPPRKNTGCGCGTWAVLICIVIFLLGVFGSCSKSSSSRYSGSYHSYGTSYSTHSKSSYSSSSKSYSNASSGGKPASSNTSKSSASKSSSSTKKSSDPYDAKSYAHPDDFYYDNREDFWDYDDAEEYYNEHNDN